MTGRPAGAFHFEWPGFLALGLGLIAISLPIVALRYQSRERDDLRRAREGHEAVDQVQLAASDAETGLRGYMLTGNAAFLDPYEAGVARFGPAASRLRRAISEVERADASVDAIVGTFESWRTEFAEVQVARIQRGDQAAGVSEDDGKALFDRVRAATAAAADPVRAAVEQQESTSGRADIIAVGLDVAAGLALAGVGLIVGLAIGSKQRAAADLRRTGAALAQREADLQHERAIGAKQGELIATTTHELRNPLTTLVMSAEILAEQAAVTDDDEIAELADTVLRQSRRAARLITEMLDYVRIESGKLHISTVPIDLGRVAFDAVQDVRDESPDAEIRIEAGGDGPATISGDRARLDMVLRNLLQNAVRYAVPPLRVRIERLPREVRVHVEDSGPGIPREERTRLFGQFERGSHAIPDGSGLGLYICQGVAEAHGGEISIGDSPLGGADFILTLPAS